MARKNDRKITVRTWVHKDGELVQVKDLSPEDRQKVATWIKLNWCNAIFAGQAVFTVAEDGKEGIIECQGGTKDSAGGAVTACV